MKECQVELRYLKLNKEKAQQIRDTVATKEAQLMASKDSIQQIESQIEPLEVGWRVFVFKIVADCDLTLTRSAMQKS